MSQCCILYNESFPTGYALLVTMERSGCIGFVVTLLVIAYGAVIAQDVVDVVMDTGHRLASPAYVPDGHGKSAFVRGMAVNVYLH